MVELHDYDRNDSYGYFDTYNKAKECCDYLNKARPSEYEDCDCQWTIETYSLDILDYVALGKAYDKEMQSRITAQKEAIKQHELAELARLKAKYESADEIAINFAFHRAYELAPYDQSEIFFMSLDRVDSDGYHFSYELDDDSKHTICVKHTDLR